MLRAIAQDTSIARILGISFSKISLLSFALSGFMGGVTAVFLIFTLGSASPGVGTTLAAKCLAILMFGSIGNLKGGVVGALFLGIAESLTNGYIGGQWAEGIGLGMVVLILLFRPQGVFGPQY